MESQNFLWLRIGDKFGGEIYLVTGHYLGILKFSTAPKWSRLSSSPFDARCFVSHEASKRYKNSVIKQNGIPDKGILITRGSIPRFIIERG